MLRLVFLSRDGEVFGQYGEGIDEYVEITVEGFDNLTGRPVGLAEEAGSACDAPCIRLRSGRDDARGIPLHLQVHDVARLHLGQVGISLPCLVPACQLSLQKP